MGSGITPQSGVFPAGSVPMFPVLDVIEILPVNRQSENITFFHTFCMINDFQGVINSTLVTLVTAAIQDLGCKVED